MCITLERMKTKYLCFDVMTLSVMCFDVKTFSWTNFRSCL